MKKTNKKIALIIILMIICVIANISYANAPTIEQKKQEGTPITIEEGNLTKKITNIDKQNGEVTIQLKLDITKNKMIIDNAEIMFLIDNSGSMANKIAGTNSTRRQKVISSTQELIKKINKNNPTAKMGIVSFGTNAKLIQGLTNNKEQLLNACVAFNNSKYNGSTNMLQGINLAKSNFSNNTDSKILVVLTDGIPTDNKTSVKNALTDKNVYIITTLVGLGNATQADKAVIASVFGTEQNPVADRFYNISDKEIETTISQNIYDRILEDFQGKVTNVNIKDYFPQEIINNFDITIKNTVNGTANKTGNIISWNIAKLQSRENATLEYVLKLKNGYSEDIVNKVLDTNEKVEMTYNDMRNRSQTRKMADSPQIILNKEQSTSTGNATKNNDSTINVITNTNVNTSTNTSKNQVENNKVATASVKNTSQKGNNESTINNNELKGADNTTANKMLSKTGSNNTIVLMIGVVIVVSVMIYIRNKKYM